LERTRAKVLLVQARAGGADRAGTGFIVGTGLVLTSEHVVRDARRITLWINEAPYAASVVRADAARDLALLSVQDASLAIKPLPVSDAATTASGEPVLILGCHPLLRRGRVPHVRQSVISGRFERLGPLGGPLAGPEGVIELLASIERGDSGGPVIRTRDGAVIGIVRARNAPGPDGHSRTAWAVPIEAARPLLR
jgi:S1-C subfamily serine protease